MKHVSSTQAKRAFGEVLEAAMRAPVAIEKHGKIRAILASPDLLPATARPDADLALRRAARADSALVEKDRLIKHFRIAIDLLTMPAKDQKRLIRAALAVVARWRMDGLCSLDYIEKWEELLRLPPQELALAIVSDTGGWGPALRQNSPWIAVLA